MIRELNSTEIENVSGGARIAYFVAGSIASGIVWDSIKGAYEFLRDDLLANDGRGGSRYPYRPGDNPLPPTGGGSGGSGGGNGGSSSVGGGALREKRKVVSV